MPVSDINTLRNSKLVRRIVQAQVDSTGYAYVLKVRAELVNGWSLQYWEHGSDKGPAIFIPHSSREEHGCQMG